MLKFANFFFSFSSPLFVAEIAGKVLRFLLFMGFF